MTVYCIPFLDVSRTDEKDINPLCRVNPPSSLLWLLSAEIHIGIVMHYQQNKG